MTSLCPDGHQSEDPDYCDVCGVRIRPATPARSAPTQPGPQPLEDEDTSPATRREPCPRCHSPRSGDDLFCENCGYDFRTPPKGSEPEPGWELVATADRDQFRRFTVSGIEFPTGFAERRFRLDEAVVRIGRSRNGTGDRPEIDLAGSPEDPAISRLHAELERQEDGTYTVRDLSSTNGTTINDDPEPLDADVAVPLAPGDRIRIGAWTTITVVAC